MGGFIILDDGRACAPSSSSYDFIVSAAIDELVGTDEERRLGQWLKGQLCEVLGMGMGCVDVRELTPLNRRLFREACERAFVKQEKSGPVGWKDPSFFPGWLDRFRKLIQMWQSLDRGESPDAVTDLNSPIPPTGRKSGPGWDAP
jgi:hypothetical protein